MNTHRAIALGLGLTFLAFGAGDAHAQTTGFPGIDKFNARGPEAVTRVTVGSCIRLLPPMGPARSRPGLGWANGTGASVGTYSPNVNGVPGGILGRVASYGTLVTGANTTQSGTGTLVATCMEELARDRADSNGLFATSGHSQGGSGCLNAARIANSRTIARVVVTCPVQLDGTFTAQSNGADLEGTATGPALIMCGGADNLAPCTSPQNGDGVFAESTVPVTRISVIGATHTGAGAPVGGGGLYSALVTACVEAALGGDTQASAALRPGGAMDNTVINRVARANFPANPPPPPPPNDDLQRLLNAFAALQAALDALRNLGF